MLRLFVAFAIFSSKFFQYFTIRIHLSVNYFLAFGQSAVVHNVKVSWLPPNETKVTEATTETTTELATKTEEKSTVKLTNSPVKEKSSTSLPQRIANEFLVKMIHHLREKHRQQAFKRGKYEVLKLLLNTYYNINLEVAAMESTPKDEAEESLYGKVYGFFKHVGHKIKDAFQCVYDWFG